MYTQDHTLTVGEAVKNFITLYGFNTTMTVEECEIYNSIADATMGVSND